MWRFHGCEGFGRAEKAGCPGLNTSTTFFLFSHCKLLCREALIFTSTTLCGSAALFVQNAAELRTKSSAVRAPGRTINPVVRVVPSGSAVPQHFPRQEVAWIWSPMGRRTQKLENLPQILHGAKSMPGIGCLPRSARGYFQGIPHAPEGGLWPGPLVVVWGALGW